MLLLVGVGRWYREGGGGHCTGMLVKVKGVGMVQERDYCLWLFLAQIGRWKSRPIQGSLSLGLPVAGRIWWKTFPLKSF